MQLLNSRAAWLPPALRRALLADPRRELLRHVEATLLVFGGQVLHVETGAVTEVRGGPGMASAPALAACARELLGADHEVSILLLLPPAEFVATLADTPGVSGENLSSALRLQLDTMLPTVEAPLELAVHGSADGVQAALWMRSERIDELHEAFAAKGLFLAAVKPRMLHGQAPGSGLLEDDGGSLTFARSVGGVLQQWKHVDAADLEQDEFASQWEAELRAAAGGSPKRLESLAEYSDVLEAGAHSDYCFFPAAAVASRQRQQRRRQLLRAAGALGVVALLAALPFIFQQFEIRDLQRQLESKRIASASARADRKVVVDFENRWGAITSFPDQDIRQALFNLQRALRPNRLSSLEIAEGVIRIQGGSEDPQSLLQRIEQDPMFAEAGFSRATSNDQYHIDLRLATVNFEAYMARHFPDR